MNLRKSIPLIIATILLSTTVVSTGVAYAATQNKAPASKTAFEKLYSYVKPKDRKANAELKNQVTKFAPTRQQYLYKKITFNTRDLGGYTTDKGKYIVKPGILLRSADLHRNKLSEIKALNALNVKMVVDLRSFNGDGEMKDFPDPNERGLNPNRKLNVKYFNFYTYTDEQRQKSANIFKKDGVIYNYEYNYSINPTAIRAYHNLFKLLLNNKNGQVILFHCDQGRNRTGIAAALILGALGVSKSDIYNDFLLTNYYKPKYSYIYLKQELDAFYNSINKKYGSFNKYLTKGIGLTNSNIAQLKQMYLEENPQQ